MASSRSTQQWRGRLHIILLWGLCVICLEYVVIFYHSLAMVNQVVVDVADPLRLSGDESTAISVRNLSRLEIAQFMVDLNVSANVTQNVTSPKDEVDIAKLYETQMRLSICMHRGVSLLTCLEDEYINERKAYLKVRGIVEQEKKLPVQRKVTPVPPTDDPKVVEEYYKKGTVIKHPYKYDIVLSPKKPCDNDTDMIILVHSFHPYEDRRQAIRDTWGGVAKGLHQWPGKNITKKFKFMFVLAHHLKENMNKKIQKESAVHDDILQGNFNDAYVNMTLKSLLGLKYVSQHCPSAKYLLKTDDDMIINLPYLVQILDSKNLNRSIMGPLNMGSKVYRSGKWKVSKELFPLIYYPPYESGSAYIITNDIVPDLYDTAPYVTQFHVDDAYITGILGKILNVTHVKQPGFAFWIEKAVSVCEIYQDTKITGTKMTPLKLTKLWEEIKDITNGTSFCRDAKTLVRSKGAHHV